MANRFRDIASLWNTVAQWLHAELFPAFAYRIPRAKGLPDRNRIALLALSVRACPWHCRQGQYLARPRIEFVVSMHLHDAEEAVRSVIESGHRT